MTGFACVVLVDGAGRLLLQERDEHALIAPEKWGFTGGHVEPGESHLEAAVREVAEETGLRIPPEVLHHFGDFEVFHPETASQDMVAFYAGRTDVTDADIVLGEGRQIVFVRADQALGLDLTDSAAATLADFLDSPLYAALVADPGSNS